MRFDYTKGLLLKGGINVSDFKLFRQVATYIRQTPFWKLLLIIMAISAITTLITLFTLDLLNMIN
ncbi:hypothetical protein FLK61_23990 [Paenalkalicoccus suaedae]|uniref:Uncharacterized protein n=1 Tax=Paenalkalicoccus suaedae TaxID=2592382 RepID=A0A859FB27_9BACI|nr:hypothetical protein [Paenalkalicoccus suaedae]QKS69851.1 hypothetical protein FLK61_23990 [Paenalkalicoccus suaedae]